MTSDANARDRLLRDIWQHIRSLDESNVMNHPAARRAVDSGATPGDVAQAMAAASYEVVFEVLSLVSEHGAEQAADLVGLHEDLLTADPTGHEGNDLFI